ncbi:MAG: glycosyltransferase, partial [bacterium]
MKLKVLSAIITSRNDGASLGRCLDSLEDVGEVIVVDGMSSDDTVSVARSRRAVVYRRPMADEIDQKNWALGRARNRWVLSLTPDEVMTPGLRRAIECVEDEPRWHGFVVHRT